MNKKVLIPLPLFDFDPSEASVPWKILSDKNIEIFFATENGLKAKADQRMLTGEGLGLWKKMLKAREDACQYYYEMENSQKFNNPLNWDQISVDMFDGLILPGGHAPGMKTYLESSILQQIVAEFFNKNKTVGAICHGVVLAARSKTKQGHSVLWGRKTTSLTNNMELTAWLMTFLWLNNYYRTYPQTVEDEVRSVLQNPKDYQVGPLSIFRDDLMHLNRGYVVKDGYYVSARWPGDAHRFAMEFLDLLLLAK